MLTRSAKPSRSAVLSIAIFPFWPCANHLAISAISRNITSLLDFDITSSAILQTLFYRLESLVTGNHPVSKDPHHTHVYLIVHVRTHIITVPPVSIILFSSLMHIGLCRRLSYTVIVVVFRCQCSSSANAYFHVRFSFQCALGHR